jgi:DNA-binding winged helix-turn-helix (wHTH) protein/TolB-like protein/tetratricopeptide (TPR) repeat protein
VLREKHVLFRGTPVPLPPKVFDTLVLLVQRRGSLVDKDELLKRLWPDTIVEEVALAHNVSLLRKALRSVADGEFIETVPKRGYRFIADVRETAEPPAIGHVERTAVANESRSSARSRVTRNRWTAAIAFFGVAIVAAGLGLEWMRARSHVAHASAPIISVAILPFSSAEADAAPVRMGPLLTDALILRLHRLPGITVRPASAVDSFDTRKQEPVSFGRALNVDAVVHGTIQESNGRLRVTGQLVRVADGSVVWVDQFEEQTADLFMIEDSIATKLVGSLAIKLTNDDKRAATRRGTSVPAAHDAFLRGRYYWNQRAPEELKKAIELHEQAIRLDPGYALAHAALADDYHTLSGYHRAPQHEMIPKARAEAQKALELDPSLVEAHTTLALIAMNYDWAWAESERLYRRAIELNPNYATAHAWYGEYLAYMGRFDEGLAELRRAQELDPLSKIIASDVAKSLNLARRYDEAFIQANKVLEVDPAYSMARHWKRFAMIFTGRSAEAVTELMKPPFDENELGAVHDLVTYNARAGRTAVARRYLERLVALSEQTFVSPLYLAQSYADVGDLDRGFYWLDRVCDERTPGVIGFKLDPMFDVFRRDPRFGAVLRRVGFAR